MAHAISINSVPTDALAPDALTRPHAMRTAPLQLAIVHSDGYEAWRFSDHSPTQGRRFTLARDLITQRFAPQFAAGRAAERAPRPATRAELESVHDGSYVAEVLDSFQCGEWAGQRPDLAGLACLFAGGTLVALDELLCGRARIAVHLPGAKHHAQVDRSSGFCVFADLAIAARIAVGRGLKVAIFDFDAHHGDGTENLCADMPGVLTYSIHQRGLFPGTGLVSDPDRNVFNVAVEARDERPEGQDDETLLEAVRDFAEKAGDFGAGIVFLAAGADGHVNDPLSDLQYTTAGVERAMTELAQSLDLPMLMGGAGGYRPDDDTPAMWLAAVTGLVGELQ